MNNNKKRHFHIDSDASTNQVYALLDAVQSENEDEIYEMMNGFDREIIAPEEIELTNNPSKVSALILEANDHVVDEGTTHTKELETKKKRKIPEEIILITWNATFQHILNNIVFLRIRAELPTNITKVLQLSIFLNKLLILIFWLRYLFNK